MVLISFLKNGNIIDGDIVVKYAADSTNITRSSKKVTNFTFAIINDASRACSVNGNYILGY